MQNRPVCGYDSRKIDDSDSNPLHAGFFVSNDTKVYSLFDIAAVAAALSDVSGSAAALEVNWGVLGPIILNSLATIGALAYTFGVVNQRIHTVERDLERVHKDVGLLRESGHGTNERLQDMAIVLERLSTQMTMFLSSASNSNTCQCFKNAVLAANKEVTP